jgi:hypothetical protein
MKLPDSMPLAVAVLAAGLLIGGTGGAIAVGTIGTNDIRNGAVTTPKLHINAVTSPKIQNGAVTTADLASSARGAKVVQYVASGASIASNSVTVELPGSTWTTSKLAKSGWSVALVRNGIVLFPLGQAAPAGESSANGYFITLNSGVARVSINATSYTDIDSIRITRTISTSQAGGAITKSASRAQPHTTR